MSRVWRFLVALALSLAMLGAGFTDMVTKGQDMPLAAAAPAAKNEVLLLLENRPLACQGRLVNGTTYAPVKDLGAGLGFTVTNSYVDDTIIVSHGDKKVQLLVGSSASVVNGHEMWMPGKVMVINDQVMAPIRFLLENIGYKVNWKDGAQGASPVIVISPRKENDLIIGTLRERLETAMLLEDIQYPRIWGLPDDVQDPMNLFFSTNFEDYRIQVRESEKALIEAGLTDPAHQSQLVVNYKVTYNENGLLSVLLDNYLYQGGAHGGTLRNGYTVDISTGKPYSLKDLFKPDIAYVSMLSAEIARQIEEKGLTPITSFSQIRPDQDFYLEDGNLILYFQQYELMPYAYGFPEFKFSMESLLEASRTCALAKPLGVA